MDPRSSTNYSMLCYLMFDDCTFNSRKRDNLKYNESDSAWITRTEKRALIPTFTMKRIKSFWRASKTSSLQFSSYLTASQRPYAARCWDPSETGERPTISHGVIVERVPIIHFIVVQRYHLMNLNVSHCRSTAGLSEPRGLRGTSPADFDGSVKPISISRRGPITLLFAPLFFRPSYAPWSERHRGHPLLWESVMCP